MTQRSLNRIPSLAVVAALLAAAACADVSAPDSRARAQDKRTGGGFTGGGSTDGGSTGGGSTTGPLVPLTDMDPAARYLGVYQGGLYEGGANTPPADHHAALVAAAQAITPLDAAGNPSPAGRIGVGHLSMSNGSWEWCAKDVTTGCTPNSILATFARDAEVNRPSVVLVNMAIGSQDASAWVNAASVNWTTAKSRAQTMGLTPAQVQVITIKQAEKSACNGITGAQTLEGQLGQIVRNVRTHFPNVRLVLLSSRVYGGYGTRTPEPCAYEGGLATKWLIQAQVEQRRTEVIDPQAGNLSEAAGVPPLAWYAYLWANGATPRLDGLYWLQSDFVDGDHPNESGKAKVTAHTMRGLKTLPWTRCWFLAAAPACA